MTTFPYINGRPLRITGFQYSGWRMAEDADSNGRVLPFNFSITDDGAGQFLLVYRSVDGSLYGDTWHETMDAAFASAQRQFGISREEWEHR